MDSIPFLLHWHTEPFLLLSLAGFGWLYAILGGPARAWVQGFEHGPSSKIHEILQFYCGLVLIYLAVGSPLDQLAETFLLSAHMVQHMILVTIAPPLLFSGLPDWLLDGVLERLHIVRLVRLLVNPVVAWFSFTLGYSVWHLPVFYEAALQSKTIHILEHCFMFFSACQLWWCLISRSKRVPPMSYGLRMIYVVLLMIGQFPVFGCLTLSEEVIYPTYLYAPQLGGWLPEHDQILGGIIMNVTHMLAYLTVFCASFCAWYKQDPGSRLYSGPLVKQS